MKASLLRGMADERFRNGGPDAADRLERTAMEGIPNGECPEGRRALQLRLSLKLKPDAAKLAQIGRILRLGAVFHWAREVAPRPGFEPGTHGLTVRCSAS